MLKKKSSFVFQIWNQIKKKDEGRGAAATKLNGVE